jgi:hypothetical protein
MNVATHPAANKDIGTKMAGQMAQAIFTTLPAEIEAVRPVTGGVSPTPPR